MQEKNYKKFYFLDEKVHKPSEILAKIQKENLAGVIFRKTSNFQNEEVHSIITLCKAKKIAIFSYSKQFKHDVFYYGSTFERKLSKKQCSFVFHTIHDLQIISRIKPEYVFISPVFATKTHPEIKPLGVARAFKIGGIIKKLLPECRIILLGGMTDKRFFAIKKMDSQNLLYGFAGVRF